MIIKISFFLVLTVLFSIHIYGQDVNDTLLTVEQVVKKYGYPFEEYSNVTTEDGYLLDVYRIPHGRTNTNVTRPSVLIVHGLLGSSRNFVALGPNRGLAFILAEHGYDVWLANCRGTTPSRKHQTLTADPKSTYWDFSFNEMGYYDLPAIIQLIRKVTKLEKISYIGHSQGTTSFYVMATMRPEYNKYVTVMISFAPIAFMKHLYNPFVRYAAQQLPFLERLLNLTGYKEIPPEPTDEIFNTAIPILCSVQILKEFCAYIFWGIGGYSLEQLNKNELTLFAAGIPAASTRQLLHYGQMTQTDEFKQYDFGEDGNLKSYGTRKPPFYKLSQITSPIALYYSEGDWLSHPKDVQRLCREVSNCAFMRKVPLKSFNHFDYVFGTDVNRLLYNDVINTLDSFNVNCKEIIAC